MKGILCRQGESKVDSEKLTKADVEAAIKLAQLSQKIQQIGKFILNFYQESSRFPIDTDKAIFITKNLRGIKFTAEFEGK